MAAVKSHRELEVWKLADQLRRAVRDLTAKPCFTRMVKFRDQLMESAESGCPNIAEGFARFYPREFARFLRIAKGSFAEVPEHLDRALALAFVSQREYEDVCSLCHRASAAATALIVYLEGAATPNRRTPEHRRRTRNRGPEP